MIEQEFANRTTVCSQTLPQIPPLPMSDSRWPLHLYKVRNFPFRCWMDVLVIALLCAFVLSCAIAPDYARQDKNITTNHLLTVTPIPHSTLRSLAQARGIAIGTAVNIQALHSDSQYSDTLSQQFNSLTPENAMKIMAIHPERDLYSFKDADTVVAFAKAHTMQVRGHVLAWGQYNTIPSWLTNGNFSRSALMTILRDHIHTVVSHYRGQVNTWDVVNEALATDNFWMDKIGPDYIDWAFRWAHEADPQVHLFYNDYASEGLGGKSDQVYNLVKGLLQRGVPIDGVGLEMHVVLGQQPPMPQDVLANMKRLAALGLEVQITEMDVQIQKASGTMQEKLTVQASTYRDMLRVCLSATNCTGLVMWGFTDRYSWIPSFTGHKDAPLIFDDSYRPKPAYSALIAELTSP